MSFFGLTRLGHERPFFSNTDGAYALNIFDDEEFGAAFDAGAGGSPTAALAAASPAPDGWSVLVYVPRKTRWWYCGEQCTRVDDGRVKQRVKQLVTDSRVKQLVISFSRARARRSQTMSEMWWATA